MVELQITADHIRQIGTRVRTKEGTGSSMTSAESEAFLLLHGDQLKTKLLKTLTEFVENKLSSAE